MSRNAPFDAVIIAGGSGRRLGSIDKPGLVLEGRTLLQWVVAAAHSANRQVLVAPAGQPSADDAAATYPELVRCNEEPAGAGPLAALVVGVKLTESPIVLVLAGDIPFIGPAIPRLLQAVDLDQAAVLTDVTGRQNLLASAWPRAALMTVLDEVGDPRNRPMRLLARYEHLASVRDGGGWGDDCDTWTDVARARDRARAARLSP